jgi:hypothetical protein
MAIVVEDGSVVTGANSYVSEATLTTFAADRGITLTSDEDELLIKAMDYIENLYYKGLKKTKDQPLQWPRYNVYVDGFWIDSDTIPQQLKDGQMQCAIAIDQGNDPLQDISRDVKRERVGELEVEYSDSSVTSTINKKIINSLKKLLAGGGSVPVTKG